MPKETLLLEVNSKGARTVKRQIDSIGDSSVKADGAVGLLKRSLGGLGAGLALFKGTQILRSFGQEMSTVKAVTQATGAEFTALREKAKLLGATTRFSATQAAEGMTFLARAGFKTNKILNSIEGTLHLAQAGALDLGTAADISSNILTSFGLKVDEMGRVVDVLAAASNSANTNVLQLGSAMKFVGTISAGLKVSIEDSAAAIGVLSDAGLQGEMAGTGLRTAMIQLQTPTSKALSILNDFGLTADDVNIKQRGLIAVLNDLKTAGVEVTDAIEIAGVRGGPALGVLINSVPKLQELSMALGDADGTAKRIAKTMDENLNGAFLALKSATEAAVISFGDLGNTSALTKGIRAASTVVRDLAENMDIVTKAVLAFGAAVLIVKLPAIAIAFESAAVAVWGLTAALAANPIGLIATAIAIAISSLAIFSSDIMIFGDDLTTLGDLGVGAFQVIGESVDFFLNDFKDVFDSIGGFASSVFAGIAGEGVAMTSGLGESIAALAHAFIAPFNALVGLFRGTFNVIKVIFENIAVVMSNPIDTALVVITNTLNKLLSGFTTVLNKIIRGINKIGGLFGKTISELEAVQLTLPPGIDNEVETLGDDIAKAFTDGLKGDHIQNFANDLIRTTGDVFDTFAARAKKIAQERSLQEIELPATIKKKPLPGSAKVGGGGGDESALIARADALGAVNEMLAIEASLTEGFGRSARVKQQLLDIELGLREDGIVLTNAEAEGFKLKLQEIEQLKVKADILDRIKGSQEEISNQLGGLGQALSLGEITEGEAALDLFRSGLFDLEGTQTQMDAFVEIHRQSFSQIDQLLQDRVISDQTASQLQLKANNDLLEQKMQKQRDFYGTLAGLANSENKKLAAIGKAAAIVDATMSAFVAMNRALELGPIAGPVAAAAIGAMAFENVAQIASARRLGGDLNKGQLSRVGEGSRPEVFQTSNTGEQFFIPPERGRVTPLSTAPKQGGGQKQAAQAEPQAQPAPVVNSINVVDMSMVSDYLQTDEGQEAYLNFIGNNPTAVKERLGLG